MNKELKKGVLDICVLSFISKEDRYGYQIVQELGELFEVKESTIYPILKRLNKDNLLSTYLIESSSGPVRKYYQITKEGRIKLKNEIEGWYNFVDIVKNYLKD